MISQKILPALYVLEVEGDAVKSIIPGDYGIKRISVGSSDFKTDLQATGAAQRALRFISNDIDVSEATETINFNPEFFPSLPKLELTDEQRAVIEQVEEDMAGPGAAGIVVGRIFDPLGDFVESRWTIESPSFKIEAKVLINPDIYVHELASEKIEQLTNKFFKPTEHHVLH